MRLRNFVISGLSALGALVICEMLLREFAPVYTTGIRASYVYDPALGIRLRDSVHLFRTTDHLEEIRVNSRGTANFQDDFTAYDTLVFALGDSYTQGTGIAADESYPAQLDLLLNVDSTGNYQTRIGVVNLGLAAYGPIQARLILERYARILGKPAACLYLGSDNDFEDDVLFARGDRHGHIVAGSPRWGRAVPLLAVLSDLQLVVRIKSLLAKRRTESARRVAVAADSSRARGQRAQVTTPAELSWPEVEKLIASCRALGARVILGWSKPPNTSGSYEWIEKRAGELGIPFNDWHHTVASVQQSVPAMPLLNPHSSQHYRGWVMHQVALGYARELARSSSGR